MDAICKCSVDEVTMGVLVFVFKAVQAIQLVKISSRDKPGVELATYKFEGEMSHVKQFLQCVSAVLKCVLKL